METTKIHIDEKYRVNVYLDTNIIVDYVEKSYPLLNRSIDFLAKCPFVNLRSSHYVLFEFNEVRKARLFWEKADPQKTKIYDTVKNKIKNEWVYEGKQYNNFKNDITNQVMNELENIKDNLDISFDEHVLHEGLIYPTNNLCLETKISKEDCLVMVSCMHPKYEDKKLDHCILLTRDEQYYNAYIENNDEIDAVFNKYKLNSPSLLRTENLKDNDSTKQYNLYVKDHDIDIEKYWNRLIKEKIISIHNTQYIGKTYKDTEASETTRKCIFFEMNGIEKTLKKSNSLYFIYNDLSDQRIVKAPEEFWNNGAKINLPHTNPSFSKYSFLMQHIDDLILEKLKETGNLIFYYDD